jgi:hypothetical protein
VSALTPFDPVLDSDDLHVLLDVLDALCPNLIWRPPVAVGEYLHDHYVGRRLLALKLEAQVGFRDYFFSGFVTASTAA